MPPPLQLCLKVRQGSPLLTQYAQIMSRQCFGLAQNLAFPRDCYSLVAMSTEQTYFDEMLGFDETARSPYTDYDAWFQAEDIKRLRRKATEAEASFRKTGITFNVYGESEAA
jgi:hypothetical protein